MIRNVPMLCRGKAWTQMGFKRPRVRISTLGPGKRLFCLMTKEAFSYIPRQRGGKSGLFLREKHTEPSPVLRRVGTTENTGNGKIIGK